MKTAIFVWFLAFFSCLGTGIYLVKQGYEMMGYIAIFLGFLVRVQVREE
jgi:hypothetical protein